MLCVFLFLSVYIQLIGSFISPAVCNHILMSNSQRRHQDDVVTQAAQTLEKEQQGGQMHDGSGPCLPVSVLRKLVPYSNDADAFFGDHNVAHTVLISLVRGVTVLR